MTTRSDDLLSQVDGITDVFTTTFPYLGGTLILQYNGQIYPVNVNINSELTSTTFKLDFIPEVDCTTALGIIYEDIGSGSENGMEASGLPPGC